MPVRNSSEDSADLEREIALELAASRAVRDATDALLAEAGQEVESVEVEFDARDLAIAGVVEQVERSHADRAERTAALEHVFGSEDAVRAASDVHFRVVGRLHVEAARLEKPVRPVAIVPSEPSGVREALAELHARTGLRRRFSRIDVFRYSAGRAIALGFTPAEVWSPKRGTRATTHEPAKQARAQIIIELRDQGATLADIGAVFGGLTRSSVHAIEQQGRRQKGTSNG